MRWRVFGALVMSVSLAVGASAQAADSTRASDAAQPMMKGMQQRMQDMQTRMQQMHAQPSDSAQPMMQRTQEDADGMQSMHGAMQGSHGQQGTQAQTCVSSGAREGLSALLTGGAGDLALTDQQTAELQGILERARNDALDTLTPEQRARLESAPRSSGACASAQPAGANAGAP